MRCNRNPKVVHSAGARGCTNRHAGPRPCRARPWEQQPIAKKFVFGRLTTSCANMSADELMFELGLVDKVLVAFVSTPGAILVPLVAIVIAGMLFHFNSQMTFAVFI